MSQQYIRLHGGDRNRNIILTKYFEMQSRFAYFVFQSEITMTNKSEISINTPSTFLNIISWLFGIAVFAIGVINTFWGNDPGFGVFLVLLSFVYFPPVTAMIKERLGFSIPRIAKIILGIFIIWAALGVGELFDKVDLMIGEF